MRVALLAVILGTVSLASAFAQSSTPASPSVTLSPSSGDPSTAYRVHVVNLPRSAQVVAVLFDPSGQEMVLRSQTDAAGSLDLMLRPPGSAWQIGLYRIAIGFGDGQSVSATFVTGDGQPHLYEQPYLPSPTSAFSFIGIGLPANTSVHLVLSLTGGQQGDRDLQATTDANGAFSLLVWPQEFGLPFFAAGSYKLAAPDLNLAVSFAVREHPSSAAVSVTGSLLPDASADLHFRNYGRNRYLWGVYADLSGSFAGEFLVGPSDPRGDVDVALHFPGLQPGTYLLATPYDWGETMFAVADPTPTATATATPTPTITPTATSTPVPTATATPKAKRVSSNKCTKHGKRKCRRKPARPIPWTP